MVTTAMGGVLFGMPTESHAIFHHLFGHHWGHHRPTTTYQPVLAAAPAACNPCQQTVSYVPQTAFRTVCSNVPVTTYRPVTSYDPCTGCPTTSLQAVTAMVPQTRQVAYTTYRPVYTAAYAPMATYAPAATFATPACGTCAPATTGPAIAAPAASSWSTPTPQPTWSGRVPINGTRTIMEPTPADGGATTTYDYETERATGAEATESETEDDVMEPEASPQSMRSLNNGNPASNPNAGREPRLFDPKDRTAQRFQHSTLRPASATRTLTASAQERRDAQGWQAAK
jgi:hypothetical protein